MKMPIVGQIQGDDAVAGQHDGAIGEGQGLKARIPGRLVDEIAHMHDEVHIVPRRQLAESGVIAVGIVLTGEQGQLDLVGGHPGGGRGAAAPGRAHRIAVQEAVVITPVAAELAIQVDLDGVVIRRPDAVAFHRSFHHHATKAAILGHLEAQGFGRAVERRIDAGPQHHAARRRIPRGHGQGKNLPVGT
jgi:hypothetical protein